MQSSFLLFLCPFISSRRMRASLEKFALPCFVKIFKDRNTEVSIRVVKYNQSIKQIDYLLLKTFVNFAGKLFNCLQSLIQSAASSVCGSQQPWAGVCEFPPMRSEPGFAEPIRGAEGIRSPRTRAGSMPCKTKADC